MRKIWIPPGWEADRPLVFHVVNHAVGDETLFQDKPDFGAFQDYLGVGAEASGGRVLGYCPNFNHFHLLLSATVPQLQEFMHRFQTGLAVDHRKRWGGAGHVFRRPYAAFAKTTPFTILECSDYLHGNRFKDGAEQTLFSYKHSSLDAYLGRAAAPAFLDPGPILAMAGGPEAYRQRLIRWAAGYPKVQRRLKALFESGRLGMKLRKNPYRIENLISLTQGLFDRVLLIRPPEGHPAWAIVALLLKRYEGLSGPVVAALVNRNLMAVHRGLQSLETELASSPLLAQRLEALMVGASQPEGRGMLSFGRGFL